MEYTSLTVTGLNLNPSIPDIGCTAVGMRSKTIETMKNTILIYGIDKLIFGLIVDTPEDTQSLRIRS